ncbi:hypothetical protein [Neobacillus cucumis]|uniref:Uncharacterized protein n=1 Tax=Neobacillus cucumis TaxID=1740721 RepID=A0A2N5H8T0_9BACI|nr:hypothetical protein [Neobacillus cucumis]PLS01936.1 hypothetical protein CVD27_22735 [Neobacillus cucumis]
MSLKELEGFLNDDKKEGGVEINWENHKQEWLKSLDEFYTNIQTWLAPLVGANLSLQLEPDVLVEDKIGSYETNKMVIYIKGEKVVLQPIGTLIIGAKGRIDMIGPYGKVRFIYVDKRSTKPNITVRIIDSAMEKALKEQNPVEEKKEEDVEYDWKIATMPPNIKYIPLNEETFSSHLLSVIKYA